MKQRVINISQNIDEKINDRKKAFKISLVISIFLFVIGIGKIIYGSIISDVLLILSGIYNFLICSSKIPFLYDMKKGDVKDDLLLYFITSFLVFLASSIFLVYYLLLSKNNLVYFSLYQMIFYIVLATIEVFISLVSFFYINKYKDIVFFGLKCISLANGICYTQLAIIALISYFSKGINSSYILAFGGIFVSIYMFIYGVYRLKKERRK